MIDIQCSPLEDDSLSLNAQYVFCCLVLNDGSLVVDHPIIAAGLDELIRHGYLSNEGDIDAAKDIQQTFSRSMELNGKKQIDVARELGIPKSTLSRYLKGSYEPKTERVYQLSEYFGVTPEWLMGYTNDPQGHVMVNNTDMGKQVYSSDDDTFLITEKEIMLVQAYRQHEQLQRVIDKILDLSGETRKGFKVARVEKK